MSLKPSVLTQKSTALCGGFSSCVADVEAFNVGEDVGGRLGPAKRLGGSVVLVDEARDGRLKMGNALVDAAAYLLFGDQGEEELDLVEPRCVGGRQVDVPARALNQPASDQLRLVCCIVVHYGVDVEVRWHGFPDPVEEAAESYRVVSRVALADNVVRRHVDCREQVSCAVACAVVGAPRGLNEARGQHRLVAIERLDLAFLRHAQNEGPVQRDHVEANHVAHLGHGVRVCGQLERFQPVWLQAERASNVLHGGHRQAARPRHAARAPVSRVLWHTFQGGHDQRLNLLVLDRARRTGPGLIVQTFKPVLGEAPPPLGDRTLVDAKPGCRVLVLRTVRAGQHDPSSQRNRLHRRAPDCQALQLRLLSACQNQSTRTTTWHASLSSHTISKCYKHFHQFHNESLVWLVDEVSHVR